ncbi:single-stranded-DNA-specific exonuclease RecJ, partial [bacterium]|nr:single-stranded-DNA-specific exonuclease RecJ [bacterium]
GDYDVDGTTATAMLLRFFGHLGLSADFYIPERLSEGYGLSQKGVDFAADNECDLIITVDCGITAVNEVEYANRLGIEVIICDHHQPGENIPPALAILNPRRPDCRYPFPDLAGVGVAFKLVQGLQQQLGLDETILLDLLPLVAIGSAADIVPLVDENRIFVKFGLRGLRTTSNLGLQALLEACDLRDKEIGTGQVVFMIAPRLNAVGRMGDAGRAVRLLTIENEQQARNIASILEAENRTRRSIDDVTFQEALEMVDNQFDLERDRILVLEQEGWHPGVIGIVASRIVEKYYRPTIMISTVDGKGKGSARSILGFDIYQALKDCENLLLEFGGHKYAAGLSIEAKRVEELRKRLNELAVSTLTEELLTPKLLIDTEVGLDEIEPGLLKLIDRMAPFGPQNMRPVFVSKDLQIVGSPAVVGKNHLKFKVRQNGKVMDAIGYSLGDLHYRITSGERGVQMVYVVDENEWEGRRYTQLRVKDLR